MESEELNWAAGRNGNNGKSRSNGDLNLGPELPNGFHRGLLQPERLANPFPLVPQDQNGMMDNGGEAVLAAGGGQGSFNDGIINNNIRSITQVQSQNGVMVNGGRAAGGQGGFNGGQIGGPTQMVGQVVPNYMCMQHAAPAFNQMGGGLPARPREYNIPYINYNPFVPQLPRPRVRAPASPPRENVYTIIDTTNRRTRLRRQPASCYYDPKRRCTNYNCNTNSTPMWRTGPLGPKTLCNACGLKYRKDEQEKKARKAAAGQ